jgi:hypothetical protein
MLIFLLNPRKIKEVIFKMASASGVLETFVNKTTLSLAAVAVFGLTVLGYSLGGHDLELGLGLLAASRVVE